MNETSALPGMEEIQKDWMVLKTRVGQLEAEKSILEHDVKALRQMLEAVIAHRQKSHTELVMLLTTLVSKLPINEVGIIVSRLVEHNNGVGQFLTGLVKGTTEAQTAQPTILRSLDQAKHDLTCGCKPLIEELKSLDSPFEPELLNNVEADPEQFFSPRMVRANRCFLKGQVARERVVREFGEPALVCFNDMTTDPKLNPRPKPDEIVLSFRPDFEAVLDQAGLPAEKKTELQRLCRKVQCSKSANEQGRAQKSTFLKLSFLIELLHYYEHQNTEPADVVFAQRLPAIVEQLVITGPQDGLDEKLIAQAESILSHVINPDHRHAVVNNIGKGAAAGTTLKFVLRLREEKVVDQDHTVPEFVRHLFSTYRPATVETILPILRLIKPEMQKQVVKTMLTSDRMRKDEAEKLAKALSQELGLGAIVEQAKAEPTMTPEQDRQMAWGKISDMLHRRRDAATVASAIRDRLHARYDAEEMKQSWVTLTEADPISLIRIFCQLPYLASGKTDPIARTVLETYVTRLIHEKYAATYNKVVNSLRNMHRAKPDSPTLLNFLALVRWVSPEAADKLCTDVGIPVPAH